MKIKIFNLRISDEHRENDQNQVNDFLSKVEMKKSSTTLVTGVDNFWSVIIHYTEKTDVAVEPLAEAQKPKEPKEPKELKEQPEKLSEADLTETEIYIVDNLKSWRAMKAEEESIPPYMVVWDQHLMEVAKAKPRTKDELLKVKGFSEKRVAKYGDEILTILGAFS